MAYFTHALLMRESESALREYAADGENDERRVCSQLIGDHRRYDSWISFHDRKMHDVAEERRRERQLNELRVVAVGQIHRAALVRHLRDNEIKGLERDRLLTEFYGYIDPQCAVLAEHRNYMQAVSSEVCAVDLLELGGDRRGAALVRDYERKYGIYFSMYCDRAGARLAGRPYLLSTLLPEVKSNATGARERLLAEVPAAVRIRRR